MELRQLRYFAAVAENESFRRASEKLHVAQPALSRQIAMLERDIGAQLFERANRRTTLTEAGKAYLLDVRYMLSHLDEATNRARRISSGTVGVLRLAFHETAGRSLSVLQAIGAFRENFPAIEISLVQMTSHQQIDAMQDGILDAGFLYPSSVKMQAFEMMKVSEDRFYLAVSKHHHLASQKHVRLTEIASERFVNVSRVKSPRFHDLLTLALAKRGVTLEIVQETDSASMLMNFVSINMASAIVISSTSKSWRPDVNLIPISDLEATIDLCLVWDGARKSAALTRFTETVYHGLSSPENF